MRIGASSDAAINLDEVRRAELRIMTVRGNAFSMDEREILVKAESELLVLPVVRRHPRWYE